MKYIVTGIRIPLDGGMDDIKSSVAKRFGIGKKDLQGIKIVKESVDARRKPGISLVYSVMVETEVVRSSLPEGVKEVIPYKEEEITPGSIKLEVRPVIAGAGPAGLFAALKLAYSGYRPILVERGQQVENRTAIVKRYWETGELDKETNVQFGEGGAGTFSDGKLTTRINDKRCDEVLMELYKSGAPEEILYKAKPHIGTDILKDVVASIRRKIEDLGGEVRFGTKLTNLKYDEGRLTGVELNGSFCDARVLVLAIGHSARDTFSVLHKAGVHFVPKPFSIGVRIEHPQELINRAQYGNAYAHPALGAADYQLFYKSRGRTAYTFCMCPGGLVVASASEPDAIVTNGMSEFLRDRENANSAWVVSVEPGDFEGNHPLSGVEFQRKWERLAYTHGGGRGAAPVQRLGDFKNDKASVSIGAVKPSYTGNTVVSDLNLCLPKYVTDMMKESLGYFNARLKGFATDDAILTGVETRTSSPVRITRDEKFEASGISGLYPTGEGAGYAGGIVSAAVDGLRVAEQIISTYYPAF